MFNYLPVTATSSSTIEMRLFRSTVSPRRSTVHTYSIILRAAVFPHAVRRGTVLARAPILLAGPYSADGGFKSVCFSRSEFQSSLPGHPFWRSDFRKSNRTSETSNFYNVKLVRPQPCTALRTTRAFGMQPWSVGLIDFDPEKRPRSSGLDRMRSESPAPLLDIFGAHFSLISIPLRGVPTPFYNFLRLLSCTGQIRRGPLLYQLVYYHSSFQSSGVVLLYSACPWVLCAPLRLHRFFGLGARSEVFCSC
jgi:hypothetical protein